MLQKDILDIITPLLQQSQILSTKYDVVITNPPYMGSKGMDVNLLNYLKTNYPKTKSDLSAVFMEKTLDFCKDRGYMGMINIPVWMFLSSYKELREFIINSKTFINMLHFGRGIFGSDFGTTSFIINNKHIKNYKSSYRRLYERSGAVDSIRQKKSLVFRRTQ